MSKDGSDRERKEKIVGDMFQYEGWGSGVWRSALVGSLGIDVLIDYVLMYFG